LTQSRNPQIAWSFSPDGKRLAYQEINKLDSPRNQIWTVPIEDSGGELRAGTPEQFLKTQFNDGNPTFSPDGRWLSYLSQESGKLEVYVRAFPPPTSGAGDRWQVSSSGGDTARWSRSGSELFYRSGDQMMAVKYTVKGESFVPERPRLWAAKLGGGDVADLASDGKHLAVKIPVSAPESPKPDHEVTFIFNFFDELRRRAVGK
jgi:Tol biopolymer transport system component